MATDLEERRLAIAEALRAIMAEPLPERQQLRTEAEWDDNEWDDTEFGPLESSIVPALESIGTMSRMASLALFGHA